MSALRARGAACGAPPADTRHRRGGSALTSRVWPSVFLFHLSVLRPGRGRVGQVPSPPPSRRHERVSCASLSWMLRPAKKWITGPEGGKAEGGLWRTPGVASVPGPKAAALAPVPRAVPGAAPLPAAPGPADASPGAPLGPGSWSLSLGAVVCPSCPPPPAFA